MASSMSQLLTLLEQNWLLAVLVAFLAAAAESIVLVGALVPGTALLIALGAAAGLGLLPLWPLVVAAIVGAILSDGLSYYFGAKHRDKLLQTWPFAAYPRLITAGENFFRRYGWGSIAIARFLPGVRAIVPVVAGTSGMKPLPFYFANISSALVWAPLHILPAAAAGYGIGRANFLDTRTEIALALSILVLVCLSIVISRWRKAIDRTFVEDSTACRDEASA
ncbi:MAG: DedA family protein [Alphaproteobacteria bacterium]|jgi:membrane protein DedA with SNARE-associated domain|nr:DedA family protein [Alphaproteobacteria bacterium]